MTSNSTTLVTTLSNGLKVILRESHDAPVTSFWVWYRAGARNEHPGITGVSHWVEHMQFKGTRTLGKGEIFAEISRNGGFNNAMTSNDWTAYYETLPADRIGIAITIESDRMANSLFDPNETESERTVILSEQQGAENNPGYLLYKEVAGTAFRNHPYGKMVIGYEHDLKSMTRDDLYTYYRQAYVPNNAFVVAAGDFDANKLMSEIEAAFGGIPRGGSMPPVLATEPEQLGERRVTLRRPAPTSYLRMGYRAPAGSHPDTAALLVADAVLSGAKGMGIAGGGPMGRSSRLYKALVATGLARAAGSDFDFFIDPYLLIIGVTALPGSDPSTVEAAVDREIDRLATELVPVDELARATKQVKAQYVYSGEGVTNQAFWLGQMELIGDYCRAETFIGEIERVTAGDVQRVARTYLQPHRRTVGWLLPTSNGGGSDQASPSSTAAMHRWGLGGHGAPAVRGSRRPFERTKLENGIVVLGQAQPDDPSISIRFRVGAGSITDAGGREGTAALTARTLLRGTATRTFEQINELSDDAGASISVEPSALFTEVRVRCLREDTETMVALAADVLRNPSFPVAEVEKVRAEILATIKEQNDDTRSVADRNVRESIYPSGHPLRHRVLGDEAAVAALTVDDLREAHARRFGPSNLTIAAAGGFDSIDELAALLAGSFGQWTSNASPPSIDLTTPSLVSTTRAETQIAGKTQADICVGAPVFSRSDERWQAFDVGNLILGRLGLMGRLGANVRDKQGLAYYAMSLTEPGRAGSVWVSRSGVDPGNIERALEGVVHEIRRIRDEPVSDQELKDAKSYLTGILPLALESNDGIVNLLLSIEHFGLGLDYIERYPDLINAVGVDQIKSAMRDALDPDRLAIGIARPA